MITLSSASSESIGECVDAGASNRVIRPVVNDFSLQYDEVCCTEEYCI